MSDVAGAISRLLVYPIKSCAGISVTQSVLYASGLDCDRAFMLVDAEGEFLTQRELPRMALIRPQLETQELVLNAPGMLATRIALGSDTARLPVRVWSDVVPACDLGDAAAEWFSGFLGQSLRLVRFDTRHRRLSNLKWTGGIEAPNLFSDGYPLLVAGAGSLELFNERLRAAGHSAVGMERFRPNIVIEGMDAHDEDRIEVLRIAGDSAEIRIKLVKPCTRCPIPNIDPATATSSPIVGTILQTYRQDPRVDGAVTFGMNAIVLQGAHALLKTGQQVEADYRFD